MPEGPCPTCQQTTLQYPDRTGWTAHHCSSGCYVKWLELNQQAKAPVVTIQTATQPPSKPEEPVKPQVAKPTSTISKWNNINGSTLHFWIATDKDSKVDRIDIVNSVTSFTVTAETLKAMIAIVDSFSV